MSSRLKLLLLLLLLLVLSYHHVAYGSIVKFLPGFDGPLPFELETGYIGIGEDENVQMFYYFIKSDNNPKEDPLLIWLSGGPGCSSLQALLLENGPVGLKFHVYNGSVPSLVSTTYSWTKMVNIIFLDQPVGAGFSYSKTPLDDSDTNEVKMIHEFLQKWLSKHPRFFSNPFYLAGDSYAGKIIPPLVQEISRGNYICCKPLINLQGYILGNPWTYPEFEHNYRIPFAHGMSLISNELYESMKEICKGNYYYNVDPHNKKCLKLVEEYNMCIEKINTQHILLPDCNDNNSQNTSPDCYYYVYYLIECWANNEAVQEALHIRKGTKENWARCNWTIQYNQDIISSIPYLMNNSISGYRSLIYSGDHDIVVPFQATEAWIKSLNYSITHDWRPWMIKDQIAGYTRTYSNKMTFATIKGSGHTAEYKPNETFVMFQRWIIGQPL